MINLTQTSFPPSGFGAVGGGPPGKDDDLFRRATEAWAEGRDAEVRDEIERALPRSRDYRLWHIHGLMERRAERRETAIPSLERAVELNPQGFKQLFALGQTYYEAGLTGEALEALGRALQLSPGNPDVVEQLAMALVANGEIATAIKGLESITGRSKAWVKGQLLLSQFRWMEGERAGFTRNFDDALAEFPQALDLRREQIIALIHAEHWDAGLRAIDEGRKAIGDNELFDINEAVIHAELGNSAKAEKLFERLANLPDSSLQIRRVRHFLRTGRFAEAAAVIEPWLATDEAYAFWPYASLAWRKTDPERWRWLEGDERLIGCYDLADRLPPLAELAQKLRELHKLSGQPLEQSLRGGSQTDGDIFMRIDPVLVALREAVRGAVEDHVAQLPPFQAGHPLLGIEPRGPIRFNGAWSVRLKDAGFHANHVHPMGWFSSALYISLPPSVGEGDNGILTLGEAQSTCFPVDMPPFRTIEPKPGQLALFPSYVWHGTRPFGSGERLTVAFDVARPS